MNFIAHPNLKGLVAALRSQRQLDEDGTEVGVSRRAADEAAAIISALADSARPEICHDTTEDYRQGWMDGASEAASLLSMGDADEAPVVQSEPEQRQAAAYRAEWQEAP